MPVTTRVLPRVFVFNQTEIRDPNPTASPQECLKLLRVAYPQFTTAKVETGVPSGNKMVFRIKTEAGLKG